VVTIIKTKNFSSYNKQYGWEKGNILLKQIANLLQELYPKSTVIRYHGDDFIILNKSHQEIDLEKILSLESIKNSSVTMKVVHHDMRDRVFLEDLAKREN
jgi:GGDEF domain-containing protein